MFNVFMVFSKPLAIESKGFCNALFGFFSLIILSNFNCNSSVGLREEAEIKKAEFVMSDAAATGSPPEPNICIEAKVASKTVRSCCSYVSADSSKPLDFGSANRRCTFEMGHHSWRYGCGRSMKAFVVVEQLSQIRHNDMARIEMAGHIFDFIAPLEE